MSEKILGLDIGSNSIGWALLKQSEGTAAEIIGLGSRIFTKAVEDKTPTPKSVKRREKRLARRVNQRRARRKQKLLNYLIKLSLLPDELKDHTQPEIILNNLGDPYQLRAKSLDFKLDRHELGRVLLHLVQRRGFLSNRKTLMMDMIDDPDLQAVLGGMDAVDDNLSEQAKEETAFKNDISQLRAQINKEGHRTLGEYLAQLDQGECKRNRSRDGGHLRTDRQMYKDELNLIWARQSLYHNDITDENKQQIEDIIFFQRPLKFKPDRIGKCSLEPSRKRARMGRLEVQKFRYLQDINNLKYFDIYGQVWRSLTQEDREKLIELFEIIPNPSFAKLRKTLGLDKKTEFNLESGVKKMKGNITACKIRAVYAGWDQLEESRKFELVEDLLTINKKQVLKNRLINYWKIDPEKAVGLCFLEFEPSHSNHSIKAITKLLPFLYQGQIYADARRSSGYDYEKTKITAIDRLAPPPDIPNPIVRKALHEVRRLVNAVISEHGKPDVIRIEMARDLEMNTKRYKAFIKQQKDNTNANTEAIEHYQGIKNNNPHLGLSDYPSRDDKIRYRLWQDQNNRCAYSNETINLTSLFTAQIEVDHILPYSLSLDDSYMNKVVCLTSENRKKGQHTPIDAFGADDDKWLQITQSISHWNKKLRSKVNKFYMTGEDVQERDFISSQLNDTRYISKVAGGYLETLGCDITFTKGQMTSWLRHQWGLNTLIGVDNIKDRNDHRHHAIDAVVIACIDRSFHKSLANMARELEVKNSELRMKDLYYDPPWDNLRGDLKDRLNQLIVAHAPQRKLSGALHEDTGAGFIEGVGAVGRANLNGDFKMKQLEKIIDKNVRACVEKHLLAYNNKPKQAFAPGVEVFHKNGKTPIKRVRILQSKTTIKKLEQTKFGVVDKTGHIFKWMAFGNLHHVEIIREKRTGKISGQFVTMMLASHRAKGINMSKQPIVKADHGADHEFILALHRNDLVSLEKGGVREYYRVQKLYSGTNRVMLRLHTASTVKDKTQELLLTINERLFSVWKLELHRINVLGKRLDD